MYGGAQHLGGGRPWMMIASSTDYTVSSSSWSYNSLVEVEDHLVLTEYPCWAVKPSGDKGVDGP